MENIEHIFIKYNRNNPFNHLSFILPNSENHQIKKEWNFIQW